MKETQLLESGVNADPFAYFFMWNGELWPTNRRTTFRFRGEGGVVTGFDFGYDTAVSGRVVRRGSAAESEQI